MKLSSHPRQPIGQNRSIAAIVRVIFLLVAACVLLLKNAAAALYETPRGPFVEIVQAGQPKAQLVLPAQPSHVEKFAAIELQTCLMKISGAKLPIVTEGEPAQLPYSLFVGDTRAAAAAHLALDERRAGRDGFAVRSVRGGLIVRGRNDLGTLFGAYELLDRCFDVRWFMPGELGEYFPKHDSLRLGRMNLTFKPSFRVRWVGEGEWALRQRMNCRVTVGDQNVGINWKWHFHTFALLMPPEKYYATHPEYFAMVNGKRAITDDKTHGNQLCTSNPDVGREVARNLIATLDAEPEVEIVTLSPNDGGGFCECEKCRALDEPGRDWFAKYSRRLAVFNNEVARIVAQKHPKVLIKVGAYAMYARPPLDKDFRLEPNLFVQLCHLYFCHNHPLSSNGCQAGQTFQPRAEFQPNQEFGRILDQWRRLSPHLFVYEYYSIGGASRANLPWPMLHTIRRDIPDYRDLGVEGFYTQLSDNLWHRLGLNYYLAAKLAWNADLNADALLDDYFEKFYGPAAAPMKEYFMAMERSVQDWNACISYGLQGVSGLKVIGPKIFTAPVMAQLAASLEQAERLSASDRTCAQRVGLARRMYDETQQSLAAMKGRN